MLARPLEKRIEAAIGGCTLVQGFVHPMVPEDDTWGRWQQGGTVFPWQAIGGGEGGGECRTPATIIFQGGACRIAQSLGKRGGLGGQLGRDSLCLVDVKPGSGRAMQEHGEFPQAHGVEDEDGTSSGLGLPELGELEGTSRHA